MQIPTTCRQNTSYRSPGEQWGVLRCVIAFDIVAMPVKWFFNVKRSYFYGERICSCKVESVCLLCMSLREGRWNRQGKTHMFNVVSFWRAYFWALIMICCCAEYAVLATSESETCIPPSLLHTHWCPFTSWHLTLYPWVSPSPAVPGFWVRIQLQIWKATSNSRYFAAKERKIMKSTINGFWLAK